MIDSLIRLGVAVQPDPATPALDVFGCAGRLPASKAQLYIGNSGTTVRFLTALATLGHGEFRLDGTLRMRQRPIQDLLNALGSLGVDARSESGNGCPPVVVHGRGLPGGKATVRGDISASFSADCSWRRLRRAAGRADGRRPFSLTTVCADDAGRDAQFRRDG